MLPVGHPFRLVDQVGGGPVSYLLQSSGCNKNGPEKIDGWPQLPVVCDISLGTEARDSAREYLTSTEPTQDECYRKNGQSRRLRHCALNSSERAKSVRGACVPENVKEDRLVVNRVDQFVSTADSCVGNNVDQYTTLQRRRSLDIVGFSASLVGLVFWHCSGQLLPCRRIKILCDFLQIQLRFVSKLEANADSIPTIEIFCLREFAVSSHSNAFEASHFAGPDCLVEIFSSIVSTVDRSASINDSQNFLGIG